MPIHGSWKSMIQNMKKQYKSGKVTCRPFSDGSKVCASKRAWSIFFATINKMGADDTKPRPAKINETVFQETVNAYIQSLITWAIKDKQLT